MAQILSGKLTEEMKLLLFYSSHTVVFGSHVCTKKGKNSTDKLFNQKQGA